MEATGPGILIIDATLCFVQELLSVIVIVYVPGANPVIPEVVCELLHK